MTLRPILQTRRRLLLAGSAGLIGLATRGLAETPAEYETRRNAALQAAPGEIPIPVMQVSREGWTIASSSLDQVAVELPAPQILAGAGVTFGQSTPQAKAAILLEAQRTLLRITVPRFVIGNDIITNHDTENLELRFDLNGSRITAITFEGSTPLKPVGAFSTAARIIPRLQSATHWDFHCHIHGNPAYRVSGALNGAADALRHADQELNLRLAAAARGHVAAKPPPGVGGCPFTLVALLGGERDDGSTLTALRTARSRRLIHLPEGRALLHRYTRTGPRAVNALLASPELLHQMRTERLPEIMAHLEHGRAAAGIAACHRMIDALTLPRRDQSIG